MFRASPLMKAAALAAALAIAGGVDPAEGHCFKIWRYPWRQACEYPKGRPVRLARPPARLFGSGLQAAPRPLFDLPLPDADPATTALRAALGAR